MSRPAPIHALSEKLRRLYEEPSLVMTDFGTISVDKHSQRFYVEGLTLGITEATVLMSCVKFIDSELLPEP